ncbi:SulP family inorganic anion transporter [Andreprevotia chitinilytica]|uniref:SulP family inorganic anion transporter n=1 Tax=Andreprevotia chitinilytica TaxID=396808 RepID=UPI000551797B|nr:SulP family inorganic anion transporter [Andreprevotia chitinilytica]
MKRWLPILAWLPQYRAATLVSDLSASLIVSALLIPQSMAYALLAGLPPQAGLYASTLPLLVYALLGSSMTQSVGPVALTSLLTASSLAPLLAAGWSASAAALSLALLSGLLLVLFGVFRFGFLTNFLSQPVVSGFTTGTAILIGLGQWQPLLGNAPYFGGAAVVLFLLASEGLPLLLRKAGLSERITVLATRSTPVVLLIVLAIWARQHADIATIGQLPAGLPQLTVPQLNHTLIQQLALPALLIGLVGYLQSITIAQMLALKRHESVDPDQELVALGAVNIAASVVGGLPISGGFARTAVNAEAGARTPLAGVFAAGWILLATLYLGDWLALLPKAALAATIVIAALKLIDVRLLLATWRFDKRDSAALLATLAATLLLGAVEGIAAGVLLSLALFLHRTSRPQVIEIGRLPGSEHFRNVKHYHVETQPGMVLARIDEQLWFGNTRHIEGQLATLLTQHPDTRHLVLVLNAVNGIDYTGADWLIRLQTHLRERGIRVHLTEVKALVMEQLQRGGVLERLDGEVFLSTHAAVLKLAESVD